jgi:hypothetical protein
LEETQTKVWRVFLLAIHSHLFSFALRFFFFNLLQFLEFNYCTLYRRKEENLIENLPPSLWLKNPYRNLKSENSQDFAQKPQRNWTLMNSTSGVITVY